MAARREAREVLRSANRRWEERRRLRSVVMARDMVVERRVASETARGRVKASWWVEIRVLICVVRAVVVLAASEMQSESVLSFRRAS
jgi:hypothetical protein